MIFTGSFSCHPSLLEHEGFTSFGRLLNFHCFFFLLILHSDCYFTVLLHIYYTQYFLQALVLVSLCLFHNTLPSEQPVSQSSCPLLTPERSKLAGLMDSSRPALVSVPGEAVLPRESQVAAGRG